MKIALLIGINNYLHLQKLPSCLNDVNIMELLVKATSKYDEVYAFRDDETRGDILNAKLMEIFNKNKSVEEVFFYFSGHGQYTDEEFYYALQDYDPPKKKSNQLD